MFLAVLDSFVRVVTNLFLTHFFTLESIQLLLELGQEQSIEIVDKNIEKLPKIFERSVQIQLQGAGS